MFFHSTEIERQVGGVGFGILVQFLFAGPGLFAALATAAKATKRRFGGVIVRVVAVLATKRIEHVKGIFFFFRVFGPVFTQDVVGQVAVIVFLGDHLVDGHVDVRGVREVMCVFLICVWGGEGTVGGVVWLG